MRDIMRIWLSSRNGKAACRFSLTGISGKIAEIFLKSNSEQVRLLEYFSVISFLEKMEVSGKGLSEIDDIYVETYCKGSLTRQSS